MQDSRVLAEVYLAIKQKRQSLLRFVLLVAYD
jgi:hypothetical protein